MLVRKPASVPQGVLPGLEPGPPVSASHAVSLHERPSSPNARVSGLFQDVVAVVPVGGELVEGVRKACGRTPSEAGAQG